jgi:hypothetical protein
MAPPADPWAYWVDAAQRSILFWDTMRQRGNQVVEFSRQGEPPSLAFDYELVMDGRELARPVNYMLLRLEPPARFAVDPTKRPYVIIEPRSGARPGIAASSVASEVGVAMQGGHPVYLVAFRRSGTGPDDGGHRPRPGALPAEGQDPARRRSGPCTPRPRASRSWSATARQAGR